jgi:hypothetical protein
LSAVAPGHVLLGVVSNGSPIPLRLILEPWGDEYAVPAGCEMSVIGDRAGIVYVHYTGTDILSVYALDAGANHIQVEAVNVQAVGMSRPD